MGVKRQDGCKDYPTTSPRWQSRTTASNTYNQLLRYSISEAREFERGLLYGSMDDFQRIPNDYPIAVTVRRKPPVPVGRSGLFVDHFDFETLAPAAQVQQHVHGETTVGDAVEGAIVVDDVHDLDVPLALLLVQELPSVSRMVLV